MTRHSKFQRVLCILILLALIATPYHTMASTAEASGFSFVILNSYRKTIQIRQSFYLAAITSNGKKPTWKSSDSKVASVNTYGQVTGKRGGTCRITAKIRGAEASCTVTVQKTTISMAAKTISMENGATYQLKARTSNNSPITWKSSRKSVAAIDESGWIEAFKPGETVITAKADGTQATCRVTVRKPKVTLSQSRASLYRKQTLALTANVSNGRKPVWKSRKTSVAAVNDRGVVTAKKHGTAVITATVDGVRKECEITVKSPVIKLSAYSVKLKAGKKTTLRANVSSGIAPAWTSSRSAVATVNSQGTVTAKKKGTCYIYATEDGTRERCTITVTAK